MNTIRAGFLSLASLLLTTVAVADDNVMVSKLPGKWYKADASALRQEINGYISQVKDPQIKDPVMALILPHAGYSYSGSVAAYGIKQIVGKKYSRVVIIGISHYGLPADIVSVPSFTHIQTPLGKVALDQKAISVLRGCPLVQDYSKMHIIEHSDQIEVPFLQVALKDFQIVPMLVGPLSADGVVMMANALKTIVDDNTLVVISSDFTHYGNKYHYLPFPVDAKTEGELAKLDKRAFGLICKKDCAGFTEFTDHTGDTICGQDAIRVLLTMLPPAAKVNLLKYDTSGRQAGNFDMSVSYAAFAVTGNWGAPAKNMPGVQDVGELTDADRQMLLTLARKTLVWYLQKNDYPEIKDLGIEPTPELKLDRGVFVTLHKNGQLRGCIGEIFPSRPLYMAVMRTAINAGVNDYRFAKITADELNSIDIEISVLTPPKPVPTWQDIVIGRDGIILDKFGRTTVFLPQVATEQKWDLETTLSQLAVKGGFGPDDWREKSAFMVFQADVFGEKTAKTAAKP